MKNKKTKNILLFILVCALISPLIYTGMKNHLTAINQEIFEADRYVENEATDGEKVMIPKLSLADACDANGENCLTDVLLISGKIDRATILSAKEWSEKNLSTEFSTVCLNSIGGNNAVAVDFMKLIRDNSYNSCLASTYKIKEPGKENQSDGKTKSYSVKHKSCYSACPLIIASANKRILIGDSFKIGIHTSGTNIAGQKIDFGGGEYYEAINPELTPFLKFSQTIPFSNMYILSDDELHKSGLFNEYTGSRMDKDLALRLNGCKSEYFISKECPMDGVTSPF